MILVKYRMLLPNGYIETLDIAEAEAYKYKCNGVMLIFDTYDSILVRFYENRTYMLDINLRRFERHDVFYKTI